MRRRSDTLYEDAMIAGTTQTHKLTIVTRDVTAFTPFGVSVLNPFTTDSPQPGFERQAHSQRRLQVQSP